MKETKVVHGIALEKRTCVCGCGHHFWVRPESDVKFRSSWCHDGGSEAWGTKAFSCETGKAGRPTEPMPEGMVSAQAIARLMGVEIGTVYNWCRSEIIPFELTESEAKCFDREQVAIALEDRAKKRRPPPPRQ